MSWLRIDDGFAEHYKIAELTDREFRVWIRVLCYAARNNGKSGRLSLAMRKEIVGLTRPITLRFVALGLLDEDADANVLCVHDWRAYNPADPTAASRMKRHRDRNSTVTEGVTDAVTDGVTQTVTEGEHDRNGNGPSRVGTRARPVPSPTPKTKPRAVTSQETPREADEANSPEIDFDKVLKAVDW